MSSINFNLFSDNWFKNSPKLPFQPINLLPLLQPFNPFRPQQKAPSFAAISLRNPFPRKPEKPVEPQPGSDEPNLDDFDWYAFEDKYLPDLRYDPAVESILNEGPRNRFLRTNRSLFRILNIDPETLRLREDATPEEKEEIGKRWNALRTNPFVQFMLRASEIATKVNELEIEENSTPYRKEDEQLWQALPHVIGPDGRPIPRKSIKSKEESDDKFWDFAKQFFFGLWGFRQRPYPAGKPIDIAQAIGYTRLEDRYYDFIMRSGGFFYKDRLGRTRGPMELIQLKTAWSAGIIDKHTFIWMEDMDEWAPIGMVYGMERAIATWEVRLGAAATAFLHKLQKGIPPWVPLKGHEEKTYKQLQEEAIEAKTRDMAVLEANGGIWPGVRIPSYSLFLWASGSELTPTLEADTMPNKYIPKDLRAHLQKIIPGLRPWEVLSIEQAMDKITYGGEWFREPLGTMTSGPYFIKEYTEDQLRNLENFAKLSATAYRRLSKSIPGFDTIVQIIRDERLKMLRRRREKRHAKQKAEAEQEILRDIRDKCS